jgi:hypothetical protein
MTYRREISSSFFDCDSCTDHIEVDETGFDEALEAAKAEGWRAYIGPDKKWAHSCPSCTEDFAKERRR